MLVPKTHEPPQDMKVRLVTQYDDRIPDIFTSFRCNTDSIKEALEAEVDYWDCHNPVLVDAPPGKGKTSFVYEVLIPLAIKMRRNILLIANRVTLSIQMKMEIMELIESPLLGRLTDQGIRETDIFGNVAVLSYHSLPRFLQDPGNAQWLEHVVYVVADECHYFTADSAFNDLTGYHLRLITKHFKHAIRIYMTATRWDVLQPLAEAEQAIDYFRERFTHSLAERRFYRYWWPQDYSFVDLHFYKDLEEIEQLIVGNPNEKYMVFVDSRDSGRALADALGKNRATYLDAESKGTKAMSKLLKENHFDTQVLVTTKVLDCGVNCWDEKLHNVVVMSDDRVSMIQMLGRKRRKPGERVSLYVCDMNPKVIAKRYCDGQELLVAQVRYNEADEEERRRMAREFWRNDDPRFRRYFSLTDQHGILPNKVAFWALEKKDYFYRKLLSEGLTFREAVCSWLGKNLEPDGVPADELTAFCEAHLGQELNEEEIVMVRKLIVKTAVAKGYLEPQPTRVATLGQEALNNRLYKVESPYRFEKKRWVILKEEKCDV